MIKIFKRTSNASEEPCWKRRYTPEGIIISQSIDGAQLNAPLLQGYLTQLQDDGFADERTNGYLINWDALYSALTLEGNEQLAGILSLPEQTQKLPVLNSSGAITDERFSIVLAGWQDPSGFSDEVKLTGAILSANGIEEVMRVEHWRLISEVRQFARRSPEERNDLNHRQQWGRIRQLAIAANARLDDFLYRSVVITPEKLQIGIRKLDTESDDTVVEIEPRFPEAPPNWLERFDSFSDVQNRYDITTEQGIVQVLIAPKVKSVLQKIRKYRGRRVAGVQAEAFLLNPYSALGEDAKDVIEEETLTQAKENAGIAFDKFFPQIECDDKGYPYNVGILIESQSSSSTIWFSDDELKDFVRVLESKINYDHQLMGWKGYDFELTGAVREDLKLLKDAINKREILTPGITHGQIYDLSQYGPRIEGIDFDKLIYSPYIAKKDDDEGWFPENVRPFVGYKPEGSNVTELIPVTSENIAELEEKICEAKQANTDGVKVSFISQKIKIKEAEIILQPFKDIESEIRKGRFSPPLATINRAKPKTLIISTNIQLLKYEEGRREILEIYSEDPILPKNLRPGTTLLPHQRKGVAWLQHLYNCKLEYFVRGALLADDMGLGKTLQLLSFISCLLETIPDTSPMLIVAPVTLLENWKEEADKFFIDLPIMTAYGDSLRLLRIPKHLIDERLQKEDGLVNFLKPNWIGSAKIVLTTYETLRDLEFSFASQHWSVMICDEAQKIKNPNAMVTKAALKQNVDFKIACTGTSVENDLTDLWCLFDFIQPGLLGTLNEFGQKYRKPIEAKTDEEKLRVEELRNRIAPQIIRRTKKEVAKDLPNKIVDEQCRNLTISIYQRNLYADAIDKFRGRNNQNKDVSPFKNHLGLLHYLRLVCTDPQRYGMTVFKPEPVVDYRSKAPKLDWLLKQLFIIKRQEEKAIIFCEFREIQRLLQYYIELVFEFRPQIINGATSASANSQNSRQKQLREFQNKSGYGVIILSPIAVGLGVNIQAANHVIHYMRHWNPAKEDQATDRAYRIGQTKDVLVYYPTVMAEDFTTFDVKLDQLLTHKRDLAGDMLNGTGEIYSGEFNIDTLHPTDYEEEDNLPIFIGDATKMDWQHFEALIAVLWIKQGYLCYRTPDKNDKGVDVVAIKDTSGILIQVKSSSVDNSTIGWDAIKEVVGGEAFYKYQHHGITFYKAAITNQHFNQNAIEQAKLNNVRIVNRDELDDLLTEFPTNMSEVEKVLSHQSRTNTT